MGRPREIRLRANGAELRGLEWPGAAPPVLLQHATSFCAEVWKPVWQAARFAGAPRLRAIAFDQRGHGSSFAPRRPDAYAWTQLASDVAALAEALGEGSAGAILVGHSSGATACLAAAGMRPDLVRGVVAVEPVLFDEPDATDGDSFAGSRILAERARKRRASFASDAEARRRLEARAPYAQFARAALDGYLAGGFERVEGGALQLRCRPEVEGWAYDGAAALDVWPLVEKIDAPVLVLAAEHTAMAAPLLERLRDRVADLRVERLAGATHFAALEQPQAVGARLAAFLAELVIP